MYSDSRIPDNLIVDSCKVVSQLMGKNFFFHNRKIKQIKNHCVLELLNFAIYLWYPYSIHNTIIYK